MHTASKFWQCVAKSDGCWEWTAGRGTQGYGRLNWLGRSEYAHRVVWELEHARPIPPGMFVCHTCDNRLCVRPDHLFLGTCADNNRDKETKGRGCIPPNGLANREKTHCVRGHPLTAENTYVRPEGSCQPGCRICKACRRDYRRRVRARRRAA